MENENIIDAGTTYQSNQLTVTPQASGYLSEIGKWAKFLAVLGFCMVGLIVVVGLFAGTAMSAIAGDMPFPGAMVSVIYIGIGLLYFFPIYYLFKFASKIRPALMSKNVHDFESAFENLKSHYKFVGIMMIIVLSIYVLIGGGALLTAGLMS